jgi:hypothetical protein
MGEQEEEPLEGFQITGYDEVSGEVQIAVHRFILGNPSQEEALVRRAIEIMNRGPEVRRVTFILRDES